MNIIIKTGTEISIEQFRDTISLDVQAYGEEVFTSPGLAEKRFEKNRDCMLLAYDGDTLAGFWCFFPVCDEFVKGVFTSNTYIDDDISPEVILPYSRDKKNNLFAIDLVVDKAYRGRGISSLLLDSFREFLKKKETAGYLFDKIFGFVISGGGKHMMKKYGAEFIWDNGSEALFSIDAQSFII